MIYTVKKCFGHDDGLSKFVILFRPFRDPPPRHHFLVIFSSSNANIFYIGIPYRNFFLHPSFFPRAEVYSTLMCTYDEKRKTRFIEISRAEGARKILRVYMVKLQVFFVRNQEKLMMGSIYTS